MSVRDTLLFDLDGTLTDTDHLHLEAYRRLLARFGRSVSEDEYRHRIMGAANDAIMAWLFAAKDPAEHRALADEKEAIFRSLADRMTPTAGLLPLLDWADARGLRMAVVTNAPRANAEMMLAALGLATRFGALVIGDELARGKPDPLPYATALARLGSVAARALAFEDSRSGVASASAAGVDTIGVGSGLAPETLRAAGAIAVIRDFRDPWLLATLAREFGGAPRADW